MPEIYGSNEVMIINPQQSDYGCLSPRFFDKERAKTVLSILVDHQNDSSQIIKMASTSDQSPAMTLLTALAEMNLNVNINLGELIQKIQKAESGSMNKYAKNIEEHIIINSKHPKDSHYQIDVSKDKVIKDGKNLNLVSIYLKDTYLGRYMIKRNFYFVGDNSKDANEMFEDMVRRSKNIRQRYYDDKIPVNSIFAEIKSYTDGLRGDMDHKDQ